MKEQRRRNSDDVGKQMLRLELQGKRPGNKLKRRFVDVVKEDMREVGVSKEVTEDKDRWRLDDLLW